MMKRYFFAKSYNELFVWRLDEHVSLMHVEKFEIITMSIKNHVFVSTTFDLSIEQYDFYMRLLYAKRDSICDLKGEKHV